MCMKCHNPVSISKHLLQIKLRKDEVGRLMNFTDLLIRRWDKKGKHTS